MGESQPNKSQTNISQMKLLHLTLCLVLAVCQADKTPGHVNNNVQVPAASSTAGINPYYAEYDYSLISEGLSRMSEYQIEWPTFSQRVERKKTKTRNKTSKAREFDDVDTSMSWLEVLDNVHNVISTVSNLSKRSVETAKPAEDLSF